MRILRAKSKYRFSYQQIAGINYYFSTIANATFGEDEIRLLLIHLREFLLNQDNDVISTSNTEILREIGHSIAHTVRDRGVICDRITELVQKLGSANRSLRWSEVAFQLFDCDEILDGLRNVLIMTGIIYAPDQIEPAFASNRLDLKVCLLSMLDGLLFKVTYPRSSHDFRVLQAAKDHSICVRTELDGENVQSIGELRVNARLPMRGGGKFLQCILRCHVPKQGKVECDALERIGSLQGYCQSVKAVRRQGQLVMAKIEPCADALLVFDVLQAATYDTNPISLPVNVRRISAS
jgi:hypothetical protein